MQEGQNARQQIVERIRQSNNILVAVANSPSVDALSAALGLSLVLNKMNKHTTALFSGKIPQAIQFLEPSKLFESNVDALRDFIISLDKEKADRLRYKVEDDVVRIFITPYKTSIGQSDLQFSQGDFNVDLIIALGVEKRDDLDKVIIAHGRILHDATVITINANNQRSTLGAIDWNDATASSLCEMLVGMSEAFQQPGLLDTQIATALLTGIVAETERFSNMRTSPRVMTMAAQLMAAGANQQLIASNLTKAHEIPEVSRPMAVQQADESPQPLPQESSGKKRDGELSIEHDKKSSPTPAPAQPPTDQATKAAEDELEAALPSAAEASNRVLADLKDELEKAEIQEVKGGAPTGDEPKTPGSQSVNEPVHSNEPEHGENDEYISSHSSWRGKRLEPPTLGGTLNATSEEAQKNNQAALQEDRNKTLLSHPDDSLAAGSAQAPQKQKRSRKDRREKSKKSPETPNAAPTPAEIIAPATPAPENTPAPQQAAAETVPPLPEIPPLPPLPPLPQDMPALPPVPQPDSVPLTQPQSQPANPDLEALQKEVAQSAAEAAATHPVETAGDLDTARQAVSDALNTQPFNPAGQPAESIGAQPLPPMPVMPVMEPGQDMAANPANAPMPPMPEMPPLPPMPPLPQGEVPLPPAPNLPGLTEPAPLDNGANSWQGSQPQPPVAPSNDPGQFKIPST